MSQTWYMELRTFVLEYGFDNSLTDVSLFILQYGNNFIVAYSAHILQYGNNFIISSLFIVTGNNSAHMLRFIQLHSDRFSLKNQGDLH